MSEQKFKVGDVVEVIGNTDAWHDYSFVGKQGVVKHFDDIHHQSYAVEFFEADKNGHCCEGHTSSNGQWIKEHDLKLAVFDRNAVEPTPYVVLPTDAKDRKAIPVATGCLDYFPAALIEIAKISKAGNDQHNPGQPLHWSRGKSMDHADTIIRHFLERGTIDTDGTRHSAKLAWRALALLQEELEAAGAPMARGAWVD